MTFRSVLPPNADFHERALEEAHASRIDAVPVPVQAIQTPALTPPAFFPFLAWDRGVTWWETGWTDVQKRSVIQEAPGINRRRGTVGAVRRALAALDYPAQVVEWYQETPAGQPYTFRVVIRANVNEAELRKLSGMIMDAKNVRSLLLEITEQPQRTEGRYFIAGAVRARVRAFTGVKDA